MNVLVTNDDGYGAWGIEALIKALSERHNVFVIAPDGNRSGNSHHISLGNKLILKKAGTNHWVSSGTPADCVYSATKYDMFGVKIDAVVSGINKGENLGTETIYSGTCGAARQAVLDGIPGIAVSMMLPDNNLEWNDRANWHFESLAKFVKDNLETLSSLCVTSDNGRGRDEPCVYVNVNAFSYDKFSEVVFTDLCFREFVGDKIILKPLNKENTAFESITTSGENCSKNRGYSDYLACKDGKISISRIYAEPRTCGLENLDSITFSL